jgi:hypothetical protein
MPKLKMIKFALTFLLLYNIQLATAHAIPPTIYLEGAKINSTNCKTDPTDPLSVVTVTVGTVNGRNISERISDCKNRGIDLAAFRVKVAFEQKGENNRVIFNGTAELNVDGSTLLNGYNFTLKKDDNRACVIITNPATPGTLYRAGEGVNDHCVYIPAPISPAPENLFLGSVISKICSGETDPPSRFARPLTSRITSCIEETMNSLFVMSGNGPESAFILLQKHLQTAILALLILYVMMMGFRVLITQKIPPTPDLIWFFLRFALVLFFATGPGMTTYIPLGISASKEMGMIMVRAADDLVDGNGIYNPSNSSFKGYDYCQFSPNQLLSQGKAPYEEGKETTALWDMIDCKLSKYLGIGDGPWSTSPKVLFVLLLAIVSTPFTIFLALLGALYLVLFSATIARMVFSYVQSMVMLFFLTFLAPLFIPAVLFNFTKQYFNKWLDQVVANLLMPIFIFAFIGIAFSVMDTIYFGNNHRFVEGATADSYSIAVTTQTPYACTDREAPACILEGIKIDTRAVDCPLGSWCDWPGLDFSNVGGVSISGRVNIDEARTSGGSSNPTGSSIDNAVNNSNALLESTSSVSTEGSAGGSGSGDLLLFIAFLKLALAATMLFLLCHSFMEMASVFTSSIVNFSNVAPPAFKSPGGAIAGAKKLMEPVGMAAGVARDTVKITLNTASLGLLFKDGAKDAKDRWKENIKSPITAYKKEGATGLAKDGLKKLFVISDEIT